MTHPQVHRATLVGGREVAVKVQREGLKDIYDKDLALLGKMVGALEKFKIKPGGASQNFTELFDEATEVSPLESSRQSQHLNGNSQSVSTAEHSLNECAPSSVRRNDPFIISVLRVSNPPSVFLTAA